MSTDKKTPGIKAGPAGQSQMTLAETLESLRRALEGHQASVGELEPGDTRATDYSPVRAPQGIVGIVAAETVDAVQATIRWAAEHRVPVTPRGRGTGLSGGATAIEGGIVLDVSPMNRILEVNPTDQTALVEPGVITADLDSAADEHGLMYAPDPASFRLSSIGGNVSTNAGGLRCAKYGVTRDSILALDVVLPDGELVRTGSQTFKGVVGYDLTSLLVGAEGTLGVVVGIRVRLRPRPADIRRAAFVFDDVAGAAAGVLAIGDARVQPSIVEFLDRGTLESIDETEGTALSAMGSAVLLVETDGFGAGTEMDALQPAVEAMGGRLALTGEAASGLIELRRAARGDAVDHDLRVGEDIAVPRSRLVEIVESLEAISRARDVRLKIVAHAGDGNLHPTFWLPDTADPEAHARAVERLDEALDDSVRAALELGGTVSGEHGVGLYKRRWMAWEQDSRILELQRTIKNAVDPLGIMNPGKGLPERA